MGGINHQPCGKSLECSTRLSRAVSLAYAKFMQANVSLEDALIGELAKDPAEKSHAIWQRSCDDFRGAAGLMKSAVVAITSSIDDMEIRPFLHDAVLQALDMNRLKDGLVQVGAVNPADPVFDEVAAMLKDGGFERVFRAFKRRFIEHHAVAEKLVATYESGERYAKDGTLLLMIEQNALPFRLHFAQLMNPLTRTLQMFSYSSLISIEVHYRSTHCKPGTSLFKSDIVRT